MRSFPPNAGLFNESAYRGRQMQAGIAKQKCALQNGFFESPSNEYLNMRRWVTPWDWPRSSASSRPRGTWARPSCPATGPSTRERKHTDAPHSINICENMHIKYANTMKNISPEAQEKSVVPQKPLMERSEYVNTLLQLHYWECDSSFYLEFKRCCPQTFLCPDKSQTWSV